MTINFVSYLRGSPEAESSVVGDAGHQGGFHFGCRFVKLGDIMFLLPDVFLDKVCPGGTLLLQYILCGSNIPRLKSSLITGFLPPLTFSFTLLLFTFSVLTFINLRVFTFSKYY